MKKTLILLSTFGLAAFIGSGVVWLNTAKAKTLPAPGVHVSLANDTATPSVVSVKVGESVQFDSKDGLSHNLAQGEGNENGEDHDHTAGGLESGIFSSSEGYKVQFSKAGTYNFHDHLHPNIVVTVIAYTPST
jgi:plastocyanin